MNKSILINRAFNQVRGEVQNSPKCLNKIYENNEVMEMIYMGQTRENEVKEFPRLNDILCGKPLWNINLSITEQKKEMVRVKKELEEEWAQHLEGDYSDIDVGVLTGALNIIEGLLENINESQDKLCK